jgi:molybdenum cofactor cytidylyltransferase
MGSPKALLEFRGQTFLDRLIGTFSQFCSPVVVVLGCEANRIRAGLQRAAQALFVENPDYHLGQLSSMQCGLRAIQRETEGVLFTLVDHPNVQPATIAVLLEPPRADLAIPRWNGRRGHPLFFSAALRQDFLELSPDSQAKVVIARHADRLRLIDVDDPGIADDVDDPAAYRRLLETA